MKEFDFDSVWKKSDEQADEFYRSVEPNVLKMAKQKSSSILEKIKRNVIKEWRLSIIMWVLLVILLWGQDFYIPIMIFTTALLALTWLPYGNMFKKIKEVPTQNTIQSIESYIEILQTFIRNLKIIVITLLPVGFLIGLYISSDGKFDVNEIDMNRLGKFLLLTIPLLSILIWFSITKYLTWLYGKPLNEMESILKGLKEESAQVE